MGVKGLKSYIEGNQFLKDCSFKGSKLIIDGCNLCNALYESQKYDVKHGGDYYAYEILIRDFFMSLKKCDIEPFVILDGGSDHTDKKLKTLKRRARQRIKEGNDLSLGRRECSSVKPILCKNVFKQMLVLLKIPFIQCMEEADWETAALANQWKCPVLSDDSDFFIFGLKAGVLPITHFQWDKVSPRKFIPAKVFLVSDFCKCFNNMNTQLLSVFAALAGNDYVNLHTMRMSFSWEEFSSCSGFHARLDGILQWLSGFPNAKKAIGAVLELLSDHKARGPVQKALKASQKEYQLTRGNLAQFFSKGIAPSSLPEELQILPSWIRVPLFEGQISSIVIDALVLQRVRLGSQVENYDLPSSNAISRPIRQVLYGLLLSGQKQRDDRKPRVACVYPGECYVEEYDREGLTLSTFWVKAAIPVSGRNLHLETLNQAPRQPRLQVLCDALGIINPISTSIAAKFQLPVYVTCYWLSRADPQPQREHLWALLLGFVFGELCGRDKSQEGIALVWNKLNKLRLFPTVGGPDLEAAHTYSQWQNCLSASYKLNQLLCLPLPEPELARLYCGPMVHQAARELRRGITPETFLSAGPILMQLFTDLQNAVRNSLDADVWDRLQKPAQDHPRERKTQSVRIMDKLAKQFSQMYEEDEDEDYGRMSSKAKTEDKDIYHLTIRTRHKKKSRAQRAHSPAHLKKQERVNWATAGSYA